MKVLYRLVFLAFFLFAATDVAANPPQIECRKLSQEVECPLDYWMVSSAIPLFDFCGKLGVTANHLTLMGGVVQILACLLLWRRYTFLAGVLWIFGYYFDAIDGCYARYHHLCSPYGDLLDHLRDWICAALLFVVLYFRYNLKRFDYLFLTLLFLLVSIGFAAQDQYVRIHNHRVQPSEMLSILGRFIDFFNLNTKEALYWLRWIGSANINLILSIYLVLLPLKSKKTELIEQID